MAETKELKTKIEKAIVETSKIIVGKDYQLRLLFASILCGGHILFDDLPGTGKTTLVKTVSKVLGCKASRVQFTPDLLPSDIVGMNVFDQKISDFKMKQGPVMTNLFLADEINRAIPRTQSALLEAMEELQVTVDGETWALPKPFIVLATQNPVEMESTFNLPTAQMDRFTMKITLGYPEHDDEINMLKIVGDNIPFDIIEPIFSPDELIEMQEEITKVFIDDKLLDYMVSIANATRDSSLVSLPCSPRGSRALYRATKAWAVMNDRDYVIPQDVKDLAPYILSHRIVASNEATVENMTQEEIIQRIISDIKLPYDEEELIGAK